MRIRQRAWDVTLALLYGDCGRRYGITDRDAIGLPG